MCLLELAKEKISKKLTQEAIAECHVRTNYLCRVPSDDLTILLIMARKRHKAQCRSRPWLWLSLFFILVLSLTPVRAELTEKASVVLDGRQIFQISSYEPLSAKSRANFISRQLEEAVKSEESPDIRVELRNYSPIILIDDRYLFTVTQKDAFGERTPQEQAEIWAEEIRQAVEVAQKERSIEFFWRGVLLAAAAVLLAGLLHWGLRLLWRRFERSTTNKIASGNETENSKWAFKLFFNLTLLLVRAILWVAVALFVTNLFPLTRRWSYTLANTLIASLTSPFVVLGSNSYSVISLLILIGLFLGLIVFSGIATHWLRARILSTTRINLGVQEAIAIVSKYILIFIGAIVLLQLWGLELSSLTILASALSIGIGFGLQNIARNFGSGLVLIFERPIQVGDFVQVCEYMGRVEHIGGRSTEIRTLDGVSLIVPNSRFLETEVINWSHRNPVSRIHLSVGVAYHSDVNIVRLALLEVAENCSDILSYPPPQVLFIGFGNSAIEFELLVWIADPSKQPLIKSDLYFSIEAALRKYQIEIPFPQRDLHLRSGSLPVGLSPELEKAILEFYSQKQQDRSKPPSKPS